MTGGASRRTGAVLLPGSAVEVARYAVRGTERSRRRNGLPPLSGLAALAEALADPAADGQTDETDDDFEQADAMTMNELADQLNCSRRNARRMAPDLCGRKVAGAWLVARRRTPLGGLK